jgi:IS5 family transposase
MMVEAPRRGDDLGMKQTSLANLEYAGKKRQTRREKFLGEMDQVVPWSRLEALIEPHYPKSGKVGRPPIGVPRMPRMLRMYFLQQGYTVATDALEDALYDSQTMREFIGIDLGREDVPDATTLLKFGHLLEHHDLTPVILAEVNGHLSERGLLTRQGTEGDASITAAPSSTKNDEGKRDPEMHQTKKGNQWHFGMKMHIGVDADSGLIHSVHRTAANEADVAHGHELLHGQETTVRVDSGYIGLNKREEITQAQDEGRLRKGLNWKSAMKRGALQTMPEGPYNALTEWAERREAQMRAIVEHPFHVIKNLFGYRTVGYRGFVKNRARAMTHAALANLFLVVRQLISQGTAAPAI